MNPQELKEVIIKTELDDIDAARFKAYAKDLEKGLKTLRTFAQGVTILGSARLPQDDYYCQKARELGGLLAQNGHTVITGGGPGIMEAASHGTYEYGGRCVGLNIKLPHEQHVNPYVTESIDFRYFFARKVMLAMSGKIYVFFPGGLGTLDELSEILVLMQENKMPKMPVFFFGTDFWQPLDAFIRETLLPLQLISENDTEIYTITDNLDDIVEAANRIGHPMINYNYYDAVSNVTKDLETDTE